MILIVRFNSTFKFLMLNDNVNFNLMLILNLNLKFALFCLVSFEFGINEQLNVKAPLQHAGLPYASNRGSLKLKLKTTLKLIF